MHMCMYNSARLRIHLPRIQVNLALFSLATGPKEVSCPSPAKRSRRQGQREEAHRGPPVHVPRHEVGLRGPTPLQADVRENGVLRMDSPGAALGLEATYN